MYNEFYGFTATPFHITPDLDLLFMSPKHKEAMVCMEFGLMREIGLMLITGEIGIGKTTLMRYFTEQYAGQVDIASIYNTNITPDQLLAFILQAFNGGSPPDHKAAVLKKLQQQLETMHGRGQNPLLIIDDAQNLSCDTLEEVRLLSNWQHGKKALLQIMLVGQPELYDKVTSPEMASLAQRIGVRYHLRPFTCDESCEYIAHRLEAVGGRPDLFTPDAAKAVHQACDGIPRAINVLCDHALVFGFVDDLQTIDLDTVKRAVTEAGDTLLGFDSAAGAAPPAPRPPRPAAPPPAQAAAADLEARMASLERLVSGYFEQINDLFTSQLAKERSRCDKLLVEYTRLKQKLDALQDDQPGPEKDKGGRFWKKKGT